MIVIKKAFPRRTFLRGVGVSLALPFLDAMVPAFATRAHAADAPAPRLGFFYVGNGIQMDEFFPVGQERFECSSPILSPLAPFRDDVTVVSGLGHSQADGASNGPHTRAHAVWLNGTRVTAGGELRAATSLDQYAAKELGKGLPLMSLELALEPNFLVGICETGFPCTYLSTFSWRTPTTPLPRETDPRVVFERLFGEVQDPSIRVLQMRKDRSLLDAVRQEMVRLNRMLGAGDRAIVEEYFDAVRDVERRIRNTEARVATAPTVDQPLGIPDSFDEHAKLMFDLVALAYQADITRVVSFQITRELSGRPYPEIGVPESHHAVSHHQDVPELMVKCAKINAYHMRLFAGLVEKMQRTQDGDGTLLDHSMLLYGAGLGDSNRHVPHNLPIVLVGGGCGRLKGGRLLKAPADTPMMNLGLSLLDKVNVELPSIGDSTGRLTDL
jgi:hypothetical protein